MNRRAFVAGLGAVLATPRAGGAQQGGKIPRVGYAGLDVRNINVEALEQGLRGLGYVIGQNIVVDYRFGQGHVERVPALVGELLQVGIDVFFAANPHAIRVARQATTTVPIVGIDLETDPVRAGWVKTLARPGGNLTGFFLDIPELSAKEVQFLIEAMPRLQRVAILWETDLADSQFKATESAAQSVKLKVQSIPVRKPEEFATAFGAARHQQAQAVILLSSPSVFINLKHLADLALQHRLATISVFPQFADAGGLMGYGPNLPDLFRRAARYVDQILKGARPADLPIQRPAVFDLGVNLKTAKALGLTIPPSLLLRADQR
jgi:putative tryptophan/tyrosine transport system substrate-binding protein